jgi:hypothetical protein
LTASAPPLKRTHFARGLLLVYAVLSIVPWWPRYRETVDDSWRYVLHKAFWSDWKFGREIVFTYGPWGFLHEGFTPRTFWLLVSIWIVLAGLFWWVTLRLADATGLKSLWARNAWAFVVLTLISATRSEIYAPAILLLACHFFAKARPLRPVMIAVTAAAALFAVVKFTAFMMAAAVVCAILGDDCFIAENHGTR